MNYKILEKILPEKIFLALVFLFFLLLVYVLSQTLGWQIYWDAAPIHYTAWRILEGDRLYTDIYDLSWPGSHLIHMLAISLFGRSDFGFRMFDLLWMVFISFSILLFFSKKSRLGAIAAALSFLAYYLAGGEEHMQQREIQIIPFIIMSLHFFAAGLEDRNKKLNPVFSGFFLAPAIFIKPFPILLLGGYFLFLIFISKKEKNIKGVTNFYLKLCAGFAIPTIAIIFWLWHMDALYDFWQLAYVVDYKLYRNLFSATPNIIFGRLLTSIIPIIPIFLSIFLVRTGDLRRSLLIMGIFFGVAHYFMQKKAWGQHIYIIAVFLIMAGFYHADYLLQSKRKYKSYLFILLATLTLLLLSPIYYMHLNRLHKNDLVYVKAVIRDLEKIMKPGDEVQPIENMAGLANVMYRMNIRIPARFLHDYIFFYKTGDAAADQYLESLKRDFISQLVEKKVRIIVFDDNNPAFVSERFPELATLLAMNYNIYKSDLSYSIYLRRE